MRLLLLALPAALALAAGVTPSPAAPTGGMSVPGAGTAAGGAVAAGGEEPRPVAGAAAGPVRPDVPRGGAAQQGEQPAPESPPAEPDDEDVEVQVPVGEDPVTRPAPGVAPSGAGEGSGGLARTGFAGAALAALGAALGVAGLALRRAARG